MGGGCDFIPERMKTLIVFKLLLDHSLLLSNRSGTMAPFSWSIVGWFGLKLLALLALLLLGWFVLV